MLSRNDIGSTARSLPSSRRWGGDAENARGVSSRLAQGQLVEVRPAAEILATLDADFTLDGLPFMPEMLKYCGRRMTVYRRVNKTCVEGHGLRAMRDTVLLVDSHCDGAAHDGCQKHCLIFWKEAWLKHVKRADTAAIVSNAPPFDGLYRTLAAGAREGEQYRCQSSLLHQATQPQSMFGLVELFQEFIGGNCLLADRYDCWTRVSEPPAFRFRDRADRIHTRFAWPPFEGRLELQPGEYIEVKSIDEIRRTVGPSGKSRESVRA